MRDWKYALVREQLLARRTAERVHWKWLSDLDGAPADKKRANKFILGAILNYQMRAHLVWENARRFAEDILGDPDDLWAAILAIPAWDSEAVFRKYGLHRFAVGHFRVRRIGQRIRREYSGDSREIWRNQTAGQVLERLKDLQLGAQISRMVVGALSDTGQISGVGELKADLHVRRVLGRVFAGERVSVAEAHRVANEMIPRRSWMLDAPLYLLGKSRCRPTNPDCEGCYLRQECAYFEANAWSVEADPRKMMAARPLDATIATPRAS